MADNIVTSLFKRMARRVQPIQLAETSDSEKKKTKFNEVGIGGEQVIRHGSASLGNTYAEEEVRQDNLKITDYRRMFDNDGQVQMLVNAVFNTILSPGITIVDDPEYEAKEDSEEKIFIEKNLLSPQWKGGMDISMDETNRYQLRAFIEGYRLFEIVYRNDPDGKIYLKKLAPRAGQDDFGMKILVDKNGNFLGFNQKVKAGSRWVDISVVNDSEIKKVQHIVYGKEFGSLYGRSGLRAAWYHYDKAHKGLFLNHVGHELGVVKPRLIHTIGSPSEKLQTTVLSAFDRLHLESTVIIPQESFEVELLETTDAAVMTEGRETIQLHYSLMAKSILAQFIDLGSSVSNTGSRALGDSQMDFFKQGMIAIAKTLIEDPWNSIIADLVKINFGSDIYPSLKVNPIDDKKIQFLYDILLKIAEKDALPDVLKNRIITKTSDDLGIEVSEEEIQQETEEKKQEQADIMAQQQEQSNQKIAQTQATKLSDELVEQAKLHLSETHIHNADIPMTTTPEEYVEVPIRTLYPDEQKVKLTDIKNKLDDTRSRAEYVLRNKLNDEKNQIIDSFVMAMREGRKALKKVEVNLADTQNTYKEELSMIGGEVYEFGKIMAANEVGKSVPTTPKKESIAVTDRTDAMADEQSERLKLRLGSIANDALDSGMSENDTKLLMEQEYDGFWDKVLVPTVGYLISKMFNKGRQLSFNKYADDIFAFRYTAVLDSRTTDYCRELDGTVVQVSDPNYALITPPNHYGCRSFWTPILVSESSGIQVTGKPSGLPTYSSVNTFKNV